MSNLKSVKTNFTAGQISRSLYGRGDLGLYENGARTLENVIIYPTGGISRRRGLRYIDGLPSRSRLIPFEFNTEQVYLICLYDKHLKIYKNDICIQTLDTPWDESRIFQINYTQSADTLLLVHPDISPRQLSRNDNEEWLLEEWEYYEDDGYVYCPYHNFYQNRVKAWPAAAGSGRASVTAESAIFDESYVGSRIRIDKGEIYIDACISPTQVEGTVAHAYTTTDKTTDWEESAFSPKRGWPASITFHQDRLVIGGSKSLPNRLWLSKSSDLFNFDLGKALDDEAIEFAILSDQVNAIKAVVSARHLLVFTTGAEWMVSGEPLTPNSIELRRQTNIGSYAKCAIPPQQIDGATVFISQSGRQLREFLYTDVEQAYQSKDLTLMAGDILSAPKDAAFSQDECVLYLVLEDGSVSCLTSYRTEEVNAWSKLKTVGKFLSAAVIGDRVYFCVERNGSCFIESFADGFYVDSGIRLVSETPRKEWSGFDHLEGCEVAVVADGFSVGKTTISGGKITLLEEAGEVVAGLPYEHIVEPLPYMVESNKPYSPSAVRIISGLFRILDTKAFCINIGNGYLQVPLKRLFRDKIFDSPPSSFSGDIQLRALGWIRDMDRPLWSVRSDEPMAFTLLSTVIEIKIKE